MVGTVGGLGIQIFAWSKNFQVTQDVVKKKKSVASFLLQAFKQKSINGRLVYVVSKIPSNPNISFILWKLKWSRNNLFLNFSFFLNRFQKTLNAYNGLGMTK